MNLVTSISATIDSETLRVLAFEHNHGHAFHGWLTLSEDDRRAALHDRYLFHSVCQHAGVHLESLLEIDIVAGRVFAEQLSHQILTIAQSMREQRISYTEDWFHGLEAWANSLVDMHCLNLAQSIFDTMETTGVYRFPGIALSFSVSLAHLNILLGRFQEAERVALKYVHRPFLIPSHGDRPKIYTRLMHILVKTGHLKEYRQILWRGITDFYSNHDLRTKFIVQAKTTYRGGWRVLLRRDVPFKYRHAFIMTHFIIYTDRSTLAKLLGFNVLMRHYLTVYLYGLNYLTYRKPFVRKNKSNGMGWSQWRNWFKSKGGAILVTRAMGGLGDLMMMTPGLLALKKKYPLKTIDFAISKSFFPLFEHIPEVNCIDIHSDEIDITNYEKWIDLTECPAGRVESRQFPNIKTNRIVIFARSMGIKLAALKKSGIVPTYVVTPQERSRAEIILAELNPYNLPVIGIQPFSADTYKNWPHVNSLIKELSKTRLVLLFHSEPMEQFDGNNIHKIVKPIRESFALASLCDLLIGPDSSFVHLGAALNKDTIAIFGPTSGKVFTKYYKKVRLLTPEKAEFPCFPCWRNEHKVCDLTRDRESVCLSNIGVIKVMELLDQPNKEFLLTKLINSLKTWFFYGGS